MPLTVMDLTLKEVHVNSDSFDEVRCSCITRLCFFQHNVNATDEAVTLMEHLPKLKVRDISFCMPVASSVFRNDNDDFMNNKQ